jgi:hypothetical protein
MRALLLCAAVAAVVGAAMFACNPNSIGRPCVNPGGQAVQGTQVSSPALECPSRLCLLQPPNASSGNIGQGTDGGAFRATCTATCGNDGDCNAETQQYCKEGFVCAVATQAGPFCCRKICICRGDLVEGVNVDQDGGTFTPFSCDPKLNPAPTCPNVKK